MEIPKSDFILDLNMDRDRGWLSYFWDSAQKLLNNVL